MMNNINIKKQLLFVLVFSTFIYSAVAQDTTNSARVKEIGNINIYLGSGLSMSKLLYQNAIVSEIGPFVLNTEYRASKKIGIGINYNYQKINTYRSIIGDRLFEQSAHSILIRTNYHFGKKIKIDPYFGFGIGYGFVKSRTSYNFDYDDIEIERNNTILMDLIFGLRMPVNTYLSIYTEVGITFVPLQVGLAFSL